MKTYLIITCDGIEVVDSTPEAENRIVAMDYLEERRKREQKRNLREKLAKNPLYRIACFCGLV